VLDIVKPGNNKYFKVKERDLALLEEAPNRYLQFESRKFFTSLAPFCYILFVSYVGQPLFLIMKFQSARLKAAARVAVRRSVLDTVKPDHNA